MQSNTNKIFMSVPVTLTHHRDVVFTINETFFISETWGYYLLPCCRRKWCFVFISIMGWRWSGHLDPPVIFSSQVRLLYFKQIQAEAWAFHSQNIYKKRIYQKMLFSTRVVVKSEADLHWWAQPDHMVGNSFMFFHGAVLYIGLLSFDIFPKEWSCLLTFAACQLTE